MVSPPQTIKDYIEIGQRRKWSFILPLLFVLLAAVTTAFVLKSVYKSSATILIESQEVPQDFVMTTVTTYVEQRLQSIHQRIMSTTKLFEIINKFDLYRDLTDRWAREEIIEKMREDVKLEPISVEVMDQRTGRPSAATIAFTLSYEGKETPQKIQQVTDMLTSLFLEENLRIREQQTGDISRFLKDEVEHQAAALQEIEQKIARFKKNHIQELPEMLQVNIQGLNNVERNLERFEDQLFNLKDREGYLQAQLASTEPDNLQDPDKRRLEELKLELVALKTRLSSDHPDVKHVRSEIQELKKQVEPGTDGTDAKPELPDNPAYITLSSQLSATQSDIAFVQDQIANLEKELKVYHRRVESTPAVEQEYNTLQIQRTTAQAKYDDLMRKIMEARVAHNLEKEQKGERFVLIDPAQLPEKPYKPNRLAIILIGAVLGVGAGLGFAALREFSDQSIRTTDALAAITSLPVLAAIREIVTEKEKRQRKIKRLALASATVVLVIGSVVVFHYFIMDLDIVWAKAMRRLAL